VRRHHRRQYEGSLDGNVSAGQADMSITKVTPDGIRR
jgi:hypothetical protein